jgi:hypothetical protein
MNKSKENPKECFEHETEIKAQEDDKDGNQNETGTMPNRRKEEHGKNELWEDRQLERFRYYSTQNSGSVW